MQDLSVTLAEYGRCYDGLQDRIAALGEEIRQHRDEKTSTSQLIKRRSILYEEAMEMVGDMRLMREYLQSGGLES